MSGTGGYGGGPYGGGPYGGSALPGAPPPPDPIPNNFVSPIYGLPSGVLFGEVPTERFSGEPTTGLLSPSAGQVFFSPALLEQIDGNQIDVDNIDLTVNATEIYDFVDINSSGRQFTWGPTGVATTNDDKYRTLPKIFTVIGTLVDEPDLVLLANDLRTQYEAHRASVVFHDAADVTNIITAPVSTDLASATALLNDLKTQFNAHRTETGIHPVDDITNVILSPDADGNPAPAALLANELKAKYNIHRTLPTVHTVDDGVNIVTAVDPSVISKLI